MGQVVVALKTSLDIGLGSRLLESKSSYVCVLFTTNLFVSNLLRELSVCAQLAPRFLKDNS